MMAITTRSSIKVKFAFFDAAGVAADDADEAAEAEAEEEGEVEMYSITVLLYYEFQ